MYVICVCDCAYQSKAISETGNYLIHSQALQVPGTFWTCFMNCIQNLFMIFPGNHLLYKRKACYILRFVIIT